MLTIKKFYVILLIKMFSLIVLFNNFTELITQYLISLLSCKNKYSRCIFFFFLAIQISSILSKYSFIAVRISTSCKQFLPLISLYRRFHIIDTHTRARTVWCCWILAFTSNRLHKTNRKVQWIKTHYRSAVRSALPNGTLPTACSCSCVPQLSCLYVDMKGRE